MAEVAQTPKTPLPPPNTNKACHEPNIFWMNDNINQDMDQTLPIENRALEAIEVPQMNELERQKPPKVRKNGYKPSYHKMFENNTTLEPESSNLSSL